MTEVRQLTKRYGSKVAVDALTFDVRPPVMTGFLGLSSAYCSSASLASW
jgi:ABC-2 type transport system ATP-binding protein